MRKLIITNFNRHLKELRTTVGVAIQMTSPKTEEEASVHFCCFVKLPSILGSLFIYCKHPIGNQFTQDVREDKEMETSICNRPPDYKPPSACLPRQTPNAFSSYAPQTPGQTPGKGRMKSDKQDCRRPQQPPPQQEDYCSEDTEDNYGLGTPSNTPRGPNGAVAVNFCNQSWRQGSNAMEPPKQMNYNQELDDRCNGSNRSYGDQFPERSFTSRTPYQGRDSKMNESYQGQQPAPAKMQMANTGGETQTQTGEHYFVFVR